MLFFLTTRQYRLSCYFVSLFLVVLAPLAFSAPSKPDAASPPGKPAMQFKVARVCDSAQHCRDAVLAEGWITATTLTAAQSQSSSWPAKSTLIFNSDGGDLLAAIELGRWIRSNQFTTQIGAPKIAKEGTKARADTELLPGRCLSACLLSFMGGVSRTLDPADIIGFHGLVLAKSTPDNSAPDTPELDRAKQAMNAIGRYVESMGGDRRMVDFMLFAKGEKFQRIPFDTARQLGIDNQVAQTLNPWRLQATDNGALIALVSERQSRGSLLVTLALTKPAGSAGPTDALRLIIFVKNFGARTLSADLQTTFQETLAVRINTRRTVLREKVISPWKANGDGMQMSMNLSAAAVQELVQSLSFELEFEVPPNTTTIERLTRFGTEGLKGVLTALRKS